MAQTRIGPQIGIEGEKEYRQQIRYLIQQTKEWGAELKLLNTTFDKNNKSIDDYKKQQEALSQQMKKLNEIISIQKKELGQMYDEHIQKLSEGKEGVTNFAQKYSELSTTIKNNETQLAELNNQLEATNKAIQEAPAYITTLKDAFDNAKNSMTELGKTYSDVGKQMSMYITAPIAAGFGVATKSAIDWESNLTSVLKTVDLYDRETGKLIISQEELSKSLKEIGHRTMATKDDIAAVAEIAGQLGVSADNVAAFTEEMIKLGDSTNLTADEAATNIARILNITKGGNYNIDDVRRFGSAIVDLGNNYATTEQEIALMANRLAAGGTIAHLSTADILGLATAMSSVGIRAEAGGTAMTQTLNAIEKAVAGVSENSEKKLQKMAEIAGMSAEEFSNAWKNDPQKALVGFLSGLGDLEEQGESAVLVLDELDMSGVRQSNMLKALALASEILTGAVKDSNEAWNGSRNYLDEEAQKRYETTAAKIQQMKNAWDDLAIVVGDKLLPVFENVTEMLKGLAEWLEGVDPTIVSMGVAIGGVVATIGPLLLIGGKLLTFIGKLSAALQVAQGVSGVGGLATALGTGTGGLTTAATGASAALAGVNGAGGLVASITSLGAVVGLEAAGLMAFATAIAALFDITEKGLDDWDKRIKEAYEGQSMDFDTWSQEMITGYDEYGNAITTNATELADRQLLEHERLYNNARRYANDTKEALLQEFGLMSDGILENDKNIERNTTAHKIRLAQTYDDMGNQLTTISNRTKNNVTNAANQQFKVVDTAAKGTRTSTVNNFNQMETGMINAINSKKAQLSGAMESAMSGVKNPVLNVKNSAWSWGSDIANSIANGIRGAINTVASAASSLASTIWSYLHFSEPEVGPLSDFHTYMPDMMKQMASGILDNMYLVENAVDRVAEGMVFGTNVNAPLGQSSNAYNYGGFVINLNVNGNANGQQLVDEIEQELARRMNNRRAVFNQ